MEYHLNRRVVLNDAPEHKNLYKWSLQEFSEDGEKVGRDLIPWSWSLSFHAVELTLTDQLSIEPDYSAPRSVDRNEVKESRAIVGKLHPLGSGAERGTYYSMIGTDRRISEFTLFIEVLPPGSEEPKCTVWGGVSYTAEHDFRQETVEDSVTFTLLVTEETFQAYANKIVAGAVDLAVLRLGGVHGFYSDWSPSISTSSIKVLTSGSEHKVEVPDGCDIDPPRLGDVMSARLTLRVSRAMDLRLVQEDAGADLEPGSRAAPALATPTMASTAPADPSVRKLLSSIRAAAWVIAALLLLLVVKSCS